MNPAATIAHASTHSALWSARAHRAVRAVVASSAVLFLVALASCTRAPAPPPSTHNASAVARVVPFSPGIALLMRDMGLSDRIVGRHSYDSSTPRDVPAVGDEGGIDQEVVLRLAPDLVFIQRSAAGPPSFLIRQDADGRLRLVVVPMLSLDDIPRAVRTIDEELARLEARGPTIDDPSSPAAALVARMERAFTPRPGHHAGVGRVLLLASANPPAAFGPGSWHHDLLLRVGATPAITQGSPFISIDTEDVLRLAPDVIILIQAQNPDQTPVTSRLGPLATLNVPAIVNARIAAIDDPNIMTPSAAMIHFADRLDALLSNWSHPR